MAQQGLGRVHRQRQHLALDRAHRRPQGLGQAVDLPGPGPGGEHHGLGGEAPVVDDDPGGMPGRGLDGGDGGLLLQLAAGPQEGLLQGQHQEAVVDLMVPRAVDRRRRAGPEVGLSRACLAAAQPLELDAQAALELVAEAQLLDVVAIERGDQGALVAVAEGPAAGGLEVAAEGRPEPLALQGQLQQRLLAGLAFDARSQHAGRRPGGAPPGAAAVEDGDVAAGLGEPPGNAEAANAGTDHGDPGAAGSIERSGTRHREAPFAGMIQIRFRGCALSRFRGSRTSAAGTPAYVVK